MPSGCWISPPAVTTNSHHSSEDPRDILLTLTDHVKLISIEKGFFRILREFKSVRDNMDFNM